MRALIFTMTCGEGHNMMAKSLAGQFENKGVETKIIQVFGYDEKKVVNENKSFLWACKHIPHIYDYIWTKLCKKTSKDVSKRLKEAIPYMLENIEEFKPDIIVCTHLYASNNITYMRKHNMIDKNILVGTILQDFCLCPYWELSTGVDYVFQPYENTTDDLLNKGFKREQIITTGLPIRAEFADIIGGGNKHDDLRLHLNLPDKFTILIVGGGNGLGNTLKLLKSILKKNLDITIVIINGKNKKNYDKIQKYIEKHNISNVVNLGFVNNIIEYMSCVDATITRCGSSVISETLTRGKPFITREKMILNEKITKKIFIDEGCSLGLNKITDAGDKVEELLNNPELYKSMCENIKKFARPNASKDIVEFLIKGVKNK